MVKRKIILLWKFDKGHTVMPSNVQWEENNKSVNYIDSFSVATDENASLTPIILPALTTNEDFKAILDCAANKAKGLSHIILVHKNTKINGCEITKGNLIKVINEKLAKCDYTFWGGGVGVIYKKLLAGGKKFDFNAFDSNGKIKEEVFDDIWDEYNVKKKLVRLKYDTLSDFCPIVIYMRGLKEYAEKKGDAENYLWEGKEEHIKLLSESEERLNRHEWPSDVKIKEAIRQKIDSLGAIIKAATDSQNVIAEMKNEQFDIDDWYSELSECFELEQYMQDENNLR